MLTKSHKSTLIFIGALTSISNALSLAGSFRIPNFGYCLTPKVVDDFSPQTFFGMNSGSSRWYEQQSYGNLILQLGAHCPTLNSRILDNGKISLLTYNYNPILGKWQRTKGDIDSQYSTTTKGYVEVKFYILGIPVRIPMYIVASDYTTYAIIYGCTQHLFTKDEYVWVLTSTRDAIGDDIKTELNTALQTAGLSELKLTNAVNVGCPPNEPAI